MDSGQNWQLPRLEESERKAAVELQISTDALCSNRSRAGTCSFTMGDAGFSWMSIKPLLGENELKASDKGIHTFVMNLD